MADFPDMFSSLNVPRDTLYTVGMEDLLHDSKYKINHTLTGGANIATTLTPHNMTQLATLTQLFVTAVLAGQHPIYIRSQAVPSIRHLPGTVLTVVGNSFQQVLSSNKDVLIAFVAPYDDNSVALTHTLSQVSSYYDKQHDAILIATLDVSANDWNRTAFSVTHLPTVYLRLAETKKNPDRKLLYSDEFKADAIIQFVEEQSRKIKRLRREDKKKLDTMRAQEL